MVFDRLLQRIDERVALVDDILSQPMDFTVDETMSTDPKLTVYAKDDAEMRDQWRKRMKYDLLMKKLDKLEGKKPTTRLRGGTTAWTSACTR